MPNLIYCRHGYQKDDFMKKTIEKIKRTNIIDEFHFGSSPSWSVQDICNSFSAIQYWKGKKPLVKTHILELDFELSINPKSISEFLQKVNQGIGTCYQNIIYLTQGSTMYRAFLIINAVSYRPGVPLFRDNNHYNSELIRFINQLGEWRWSISVGSDTFFSTETNKQCYSYQPF